MKKGEILEGIVTDYDFPNKGSLFVEDRRVVIKGAILGQKVKFSITKLRKDKAEGRLLEVLEPATGETSAPYCSRFGICGGCAYQTFPYEEQLKLKEMLVKRLLDKATSDYSWEGIKGSPSNLAYRNKMEYSFGDEYKNGPMSLGLHKKGSFYDIVTTSDCAIVSEDYNTIVTAVLNFYSEKQTPFYKKMQREGVLRHLVIRQSYSNKDVMVNLVATTSDIASLYLDEFKDMLLGLKLGGKIASIIYTKNDALSDAVINEGMEILYGEDCIYEEMLGLHFKISPFSFFQTNTQGAAVLYETARGYIGDTKDKVVYDLYSGTGTIAQMMAAVAKKVIGVEIIEEAVEAAKENAKLNGLTNCQFIAGDVLKVLDDIEDKPDMIVLDPPRDGINPKALDKIINYGVDEIVYISCKPTSLARDIEVFEARGYKVKKACCVDQFPGTVHVETVVLMSKVK